MTEETKGHIAKRRKAFPTKALIDRTMHAVKGLTNVAVEFHSSNNTTRIVLGVDTSLPATSRSTPNHRTIKL